MSPLVVPFPPLQSGTPTPTPTGDGPLAGLPLDGATVLGIVVTFLLAYVAVRLLSAGLTAVSERLTTRRITVKMLIPISKLLVYGGATYWVLGPLLNLSSTQLLAVSGLVGAALGFGVKDLFAAVVGGLVVVLERPYQVGDKVEIDGHYGEVTDIGLRATRLVTPDDTAVSVPNDAAFAGAVANANDGAPEMQVVVDLHVHPDADPERAAAIVEEALVTSRYVHLADDRPHTVLVRDGPAYRTIRGKAYVNDLREEFAFESDVTRRALAGFERAGIDPPAVDVAVEE